MMETEKLQTLKIVVASSSVIIRAGVVSVLRRLPGVSVHPIEVDTTEMLTNYVIMQSPNAVIVDLRFGGWFSVASFQNAIGREVRMPKMIALLSAIATDEELAAYDFKINLHDDTATIAEVVGKCGEMEDDTADDDDEVGASAMGENTLSTREKEVLVCIVKGMTNKEIADKLFLSIHTVVTHRRNVARKLQIHSSAGLTIYAIVNKLVDLDEIKSIS